MDRVGDMQKTKRKRRSKDTGCLNTKQKACKAVLTRRRIRSDSMVEDGFGNLIEFPESSSSELSKHIASELSESVVSLASFVGDKVLFECTGIFIGDLCADATSILTSANIVGSSDYGITDNLTIKVRLPNDRVVIGWVHHCDLKYDLAVVNIRHARGFNVAHLSSSHRLQFESSCLVVAVGRCFNSGMLNSTNGIVIGNTSDELCELVLTTCKIDMAWIGCPLIDVDGNFVGVKLRSGERTAFLPMDKILEWLGHFGTIRVGINQGGDDTKETSTTETQKAAMPNNLLEYFNEFARHDGYPSPTMISDDMYRMRVINSFEEEFDDDSWGTLSEDIASTMSECVVSLASFRGDARCFACTGVFIGRYSTSILTSASLVRISGDGNKVDDKLRIQVYLRNKRRVLGTLKHYDLRYNVAVIDIMGFCCPCAMELEKQISFTPYMEVVAVGCLFKQRKLMASHGVLIDRQSKLDCEELRISTCRITKAGIGGPLIDTCGNFVGMNFFDDEETPYLPREKIQKILRYSDAEWYAYLHIFVWYWYASAFHGSPGLWGSYIVIFQKHMESL